MNLEPKPHCGHVFLPHLSSFFFPLISLLYHLLLIISVICSQTFLFSFSFLLLTFPFVVFLTSSLVTLIFFFHSTVAPSPFCCFFLLFFSLLNSLFFFLSLPFLSPLSSLFLYLDLWNSIWRNVLVFFLAKNDVVLSAHRLNGNHSDSFRSA